MKHVLFSIVGFGLVQVLTCQGATSPFKTHGFTGNGAFQVTTAGAADLEVSTNLQTWTKLATVAQEMTLDDVGSRQSEWRFYRNRAGATNSPIIGYIKVTLPPGKMAILGNCFDRPLRLDSADGRMSVFGAVNPTVKVSLYTNGNFTASTADPSSGNWTPALRPIAYREGFSVENIGAKPITLRLHGEVRAGQMNMNLPAGPSLVVSPVPLMGDVGQVLGIPGKDGLQIDVFNEETQLHQVSTFDSLDNAWNPKLSVIKPGRAVIIRAPQPTTWTKSFSVN